MDAFFTIIVVTTLTVNSASPVLYNITPEDIKLQRQEHIRSLDIDNIPVDERDVVYKELVGDSRVALCRSITNNSLDDEFAMMGCIILPYVHGIRVSQEVFGY